LPPIARGPSAGLPRLSERQKTAKIEHFAATLFEMLSEQKL